MIDKQRQIQFPSNLQLLVKLHSTFHIPGSQHQMYTSIRGKIRGDDRYSLEFSIWMIASKLKLNLDKTKFILIGTESQQDKFMKCSPTKLLDQDVTPTDSARNLGVEFGKVFNFKKHIISKVDYATIIIIRDLRCLRSD